MKNVIVLFILCSLVWSCIDEELSSGQSETAQIQEELQQFVSAFEGEAAVRGLRIDVAELGVTVELSDIPQDDVAGVCFYHSNQPGRIEIDAPFYNRMTTLEREFVVFHELGHCVLGRGHSEAQYNNGVCRSIMASGTGTCFQRYNQQTRRVYIDELFSNQ